MQRNNETVTEKSVCLGGRKERWMWEYNWVCLDPEESFQLEDDAHHFLESCKDTGCSLHPFIRKLYPLSSVGPTSEWINLVQTARDL